MKIYENSCITSNQQKRKSESNQQKSIEIEQNEHTTIFIKYQRYVKSSNRLPPPAVVRMRYARILRKLEQISYWASHKTFDSRSKENEIKQMSKEKLNTLSTKYKQIYTQTRLILLKLLERKTKYIEYQDTSKYTHRLILLELFIFLLVFPLSKLQTVIHINESEWSS